MARGLGMQIVVYDPFIKKVSELNTVLYDDIDDVFKKADVISIHLPLTESTYHMVCMDKIKLMKNNAIIINTSRGPVINTEDLIEALNSNIIAGAGVDVIEGEPLSKDHKAFKMKNLIITPHVAMYSEESMIDLHQKLVKQGLDVLNGRWTTNIVNPQVKGKKEWK